MRTLLQLVGNYCLTQGIPQPTAVTSSQDETVLQMWGLLNTEVSEFSARADWDLLKVPTGSFEHANGTNYQALDLSTLAAFRSIVPRTLWCEGTRLPVNGPIPSAIWQQMLRLSVTMSQFNYRVRGGSLEIYPVPTDIPGNPFSMEYYSEAGVLGANGTDLQVTFLNDNDTPRMPDRITLAGLDWRWRAAKGFPYAEQLATYERMVNGLLNGESVPGELCMDGPDPDSRVIAPGLLIAAGSWNA